MNMCYGAEKPRIENELHMNLFYMAVRSTSRPVATQLSASHKTNG
jgi:hypothetical protein